MQVAVVTNRLTRNVLLLLTETVEPVAAVVTSQSAAWLVAQAVVVAAANFSRVPLMSRQKLLAIRRRPK